MALLTNWTHLAGTCPLARQLDTTCGVLAPTLSASAVSPPDTSMARSIAFMTTDYTRGLILCQTICLIRIVAPEYTSRHG